VPTLEFWRDATRSTMRYRVAGCLEATITDQEAVAAERIGDVPLLIELRVSPLIWLSMPCHDDQTTLRALLA